MYNRVAEVPKKFSAMWSCFSASKIHHLWWRGQREEILFVNLPLKELGSPQPSPRHPCSPLIVQTGTEGVWNLQDEEAATSWSYPEGWENASIILWLAACRELKAIGAPACLLSQPSINWLAFGDVQSGEKQCGTREQAVKQHTARALNKWKENIPSLKRIKWIVNRQH